MAKVKEITLQPGYYLAPGYYRDFWIKNIENGLSEEVKNRHVKLKPYREMWLGAIIAAAHTKLTGAKHFIALPPHEPPDVYLAKFNPELIKDRRGLSVRILKVEITRCSLDDGETLIEQIKRKNTPAYEDMTLAVYLFGGEVVDMVDLKKEIEKLERIYPAEILIVGKVDKMLDEDLPEGTFAQVFIHPVMAQFTINSADPAFFKSPAILTIGKRGISEELTPTSQYKLTLPDLSR